MIERCDLLAVNIWVREVLGQSQKQQIAGRQVNGAGLIECIEIRLEVLIA
jgi:hypothetical protein